METVSTLGPRPFREDELVSWGERIGAGIEPPLWIALDGPLGVGKSVLARSICQGAGVSRNIASPSFTLVNLYSSIRGFSIYHVDLFRLRPGDRLEPLGWEELMRSTGLVLLEWACRVPDRQPGDRWEVTIEFGRKPDERLVQISRLRAAPALVGW